MCYLNLCWFVSGFESDLISNALREDVERNLPLVKTVLRESWRPVLNPKTSEIPCWLEPIKNPRYIVHPLYESNLCRRFPVDALNLLNAIIDDQPECSLDVQKCLKTIADTKPGLEQDHRF